MAEDIKLNEIEERNISHIVGIDIEGNTAKTSGRNFLNAFANAQAMVDCNLDDLTPGEYYVYGELQNAPSSGNWIIVKVIGASDLIQLAISVFDDTLWKRTKLNGYWKEWKSITFT